MRIVQFTDTHLVPEAGQELFGVDTYLTLKKCFFKAMSLPKPPDAIFITGDISDDGSEKSYQRLREIFSQTKLPVYLTPGNHDDPAAMSQAVRGSTLQSVDYTVLGNWISVFANTRIAGKSHGFLEKEELRKIEELLGQHPEKWGMLSLHHSSQSTCPSSGCRLNNAEEFMLTLARCRNLKVVLSGHLHVAIDEMKNGVRMLTTPSTFAHGNHPRKEQNLDFENFWASHSLDKTRQGFRVVDLKPDGGLETQVHWA